MPNGPKNGLTYTQNDREKWQNTFTMIVSASLHVLVSEKVQQASTITLAPRCSHASDFPAPAMVEFLSNPFIPCNLRPKYLKTGGVYPLFTTCSMRPEGGPLGQAGKPRPKGCGPLPLPRGQATLHFWAVGGAMLSLTPKNHIRGWFGTYTWSVVGVGAPLCREKKTEKTAKQSFQRSWTEFLQCPYLQTGMRTPFFFAFIAKSISNSTQKCEKKFRIFWTPPPRKKKFPAMPS